MATTPEGRVKAKISATLKRPGVWYNMPVPGGYGRPSLDYVGMAYGRGFAIEAKRPGGKPTAQQRRTIQEMRDAGGRVFVIDGDTGPLERWLEQTEASSLSGEEDMVNDIITGAHRVPGRAPFRCVIQFGDKVISQEIPTGETVLELFKRFIQRNLQGDDQDYALQWLAMEETPLAHWAVISGARPRKWRLCYQGALDATPYTRRSMAQEK